MALMTLMFQLGFKTYFILILRSLLVGAAPEQGSLYMWIDARQARILLGKKKKKKKKERHFHDAKKCVIVIL